MCFGMRVLLLGGHMDLHRTVRHRLWPKLLRPIRSGRKHEYVLRGTGQFSDHRVQAILRVVWLVHQHTHLHICRVPGCLHSLCTDLLGPEQGAAIPQEAGSFKSLIKPKVRRINQTHFSYEWITSSSIFAFSAAICLSAACSILVSLFVACSILWRTDITEDCASLMRSPTAQSAKRPSKK